jgi:hypothetical protein
MKQTQIDINEQFQHALDIMEDSDRSIFIDNPTGYPPACWWEESGSP